jgi:hypothetical protein
VGPMSAFTHRLLRALIYSEIACITRQLFDGADVCFDTWIVGALLYCEIDPSSGSHVTVPMSALTYTL